MASPLFSTAQRRKAKLRLGIDGPSGSGKTYSALLIAKGLARGDLAKVALIDTENGSGSLYADLGPYAILDFGPPYSVARFVKAHDAAVAEGYEVIVVDSLTHFWSGEGGILDAVDKIAAASNSGNSFAAWKKGTPLQKLFMDTMLASPAHIIATVRSKVEWVIEENDKGRKVPRKVGMAPEQRKDLEYEFSLMFDLSREHIASAGKDRTGLFDDRLEVPSEKMGAELLAWLESGTDAPEPRAAPSPEPVAETKAAPVATNGKITEAQVNTLKTLRKRLGMTIGDWTEALAQYDAASAFDLTTEQAAQLIGVIHAALTADSPKIPETAQEPPSAPVVAETPAGPPAATEAAESADGADDLDGMDDADKTFLQGCDDDNAAEQSLRNEPDGTVAAKQLQRLGIICARLERCNIDWRPIMQGVIGREVISRKKLSFEEAREVIKTVAAIEKTLPAEAVAS